MKFKEGDTIQAVERGLGFEEATVTDIVEYKKRQCYKVDIPCGYAYIPVDSEVNYKLKDKKRNGRKTVTN